MDHIIFLEGGAGVDEKFSSANKQEIIRVFEWL